MKSCADCGIKPADRAGLVLIIMRGIAAPFALCGRCWLKRGQW